MDRQIFMQNVFWVRHVDNTWSLIRKTRYCDDFSKTNITFLYDHISEKEYFKVRLKEGMKEGVY